MILSDNETKVDLLNNEAIAKTIVSLIRDSKDQPMTLRQRSARQWARDSI